MLYLKKAVVLLEVHLLRGMKKESMKVTLIPAYPTKQQKKTHVDRTKPNHARRLYKILIEGLLLRVVLLCELVERGAFLDRLQVGIIIQRI